MQERHVNRARYFEELATSCEKYFLPYLTRFVKLTPHSRILEVGCGDGGNLLPFALQGCDVTGVDISEKRIADARAFFADNHVRINLFASDIFDLPEPQSKYDVVLVHDVIEHVSEKELFLNHIRKFVKNNGVIFVGFPAWLMPFGGHQQICKNKIPAHLPFLHLLPMALYRKVLEGFGEDSRCVDELVDIKRCGLTIESFEELLGPLSYEVVERHFWLINPHYEVKFGLKPRALPRFLCSMPYLRNFMTTSCFYVLKSVN
ncbi:MAG: class I SAM-dependent methyltransferase [Bacteroidales bacterium]